MCERGNYSTSNSSEKEEISKSPIICLIAFFQCFSILLKTLVNNSFHLSWEPNWLLLKKYAIVHPRNFFIVRICIFITIRFFYGFQKFFIVAGLLSNSLYNICTYFILNSIYFFPIIHCLQVANTSIKFDNYNFYIRGRFWKHCMKWLNFILII